MRFRLRMPGKQSLDSPRSMVKAPMAPEDGGSTVITVAQATPMVFLFSFSSFAGGWLRSLAWKLLASQVGVTELQQMSCTSSGPTAASSAVGGRNFLAQTGLAEVSMNWMGAPEATRISLGCKNTAACNGGKPQIVGWCYCLCNAAKNTDFYEGKMLVQAK